jgi:hypothetical protein
MGTEFNAKAQRRRDAGKYEMLFAPLRLCVKIQSMAPTVKAEAVRWFVSKFGIKSNAIYASKFYIPEKSWTRKSAWWFEIPKQTIETTPKPTEIHLLCQVAPDANDFHCLKAPINFLETELPNLCVRKNGKVSLFLSAERHEIFVEQRGRGKVSFARLLKPNNQAT